MKRTAVRRRKRMVSAARTDARRQLKAELDRLCREIVFRRAGYKCEWCGSEKRLQWAHIMPRRYRHLVHDPANALCLCMHHHLFVWHRNPLEAAAWLASYKGTDFLQLLRIRAEAGAGKPDMEARLLWLKRQA